MASFKDLQEMVKNGEFSKELMKDEEFKSKLKEILKEESDTEITDDQIPEIIKTLEKNVNGDKSLDADDLDAVSGGKIGAKATKTILGTAGFILGATVGGSAGNRVGDKIGARTGDMREFLSAKKEDQDKVGKEKGYIDEEGEMTPKFWQEAKKASIPAGAGVITGATAGTIGGVQLANLLIKKFDLK